MKIQIAKNLFILQIHQIPIPLLNYVFYFGDLSVEDQKLYIKSIIETIKKANHVSIINKNNSALN